MLECRTCCNGCVQVEWEQPHTKYRPWIPNQPDDEKDRRANERTTGISLSFLQVGGLPVGGRIEEVEVRIGLSVDEDRRRKMQNTGFWSTLARYQKRLRYKQPNVRMPSRSIIPVKSSKCPM